MPISFSSPVARDARARGAGVTAVLGPTNTGKTHLAIERMLAHSSGIIGLPLRLLAREVYNKVAERAGPEAVALITGEEKIKPANPRFWVSTVEAMPRDLDVAFVAIDEVQLGADLERGHVFTDRMLNRRGREETLVLGAADRAADGRAVAAGRPCAHQAAAVALGVCRREEDHAPAAPLRRRRLLVRGGLCHRRADPPSARRRRRGDGGAEPAHPQRAGRALPVRRRRISGRHRCDRHGAQSRRRPRRLRVRPQVRRLSVPPAQSGRARPDRRPRRPRHARRHLRHHRPLPAVRDRACASAREPFVRARQGAAVAQYRARFLLARRLAGDAGVHARGSGLEPRAGRRGHPGARARGARRRRARVRDHGANRSSGCGRCARFPTIGRARPLPMPSW